MICLGLPRGVYCETESQSQTRSLVWDCAFVNSSGAGKVFPHRPAPRMARAVSGDAAIWDHELRGRAERSTANGSRRIRERFCACRVLRQANRCRKPVSSLRPLRAAVPPMGPLGSAEAFQKTSGSFLFFSGSSVQRISHGEEERFRAADVPGLPALPPTDRAVGVCHRVRLFVVVVTRL
jgi:hypothetical protein